MITAWHRSNEGEHGRLDGHPWRRSGIIHGPGEQHCRSKGLPDRDADFSAWVGLVPKQQLKTGVRTGSAVLEQGKVIAICAACSCAGALAVIRLCQDPWHQGMRPWLTALLVRRPTKVAAIALANKIARMAWAMMAKGERYKEPIALAA